MWYSFSSYKVLNTDSEKVRQTLWIKILKILHEEEWIYWNIEYRLYEFEMNNKVYREYISEIETWNGNYRDETISFYDISEWIGDIKYTSINQGECSCNKCKSFYITIITHKDWTKTYICENCKFETNWN